MLNKIIKELEAKIEESKNIKIESTIVQSIEAGRRNAFKSAIYIIKNHESEFEQTIKKAFLASNLELSDYKSAQDYYNQNYKNEQN